MRILAGFAGGLPSSIARGSAADPVDETQAATFVFVAPALNGARHEWQDFNPGPTRLFVPA